MMPKSAPSGAAPGRKRHCPTRPRRRYAASHEPSRIDPLRIGILGGGRIARQFVRDVALGPRLRVVAGASRDAVMLLEAYPYYFQPQTA